MGDILKLVRIQLVVSVVFVFFKAIRPSVMASESPKPFKLFLLSAPSLFEAIIGTFVLTCIGLVVNSWMKTKYQLHPNWIYALATLLTGAFVVLREFEIVAPRPSGTFDVNDVVFSIVGLIVGGAIVLLNKPVINPPGDTDQ